MDELTNLQKIAVIITGYNPFTDDNSGGDNNAGGYYDKDTTEEKLAYLIMIGNVHEGVLPISANEAETVYRYIERVCNSQNEKFWAFKKL